MGEKIIITAALTGSRPTKEMNPAVPYSPKEIVEAAAACHKAGAAIVHVHVRDPKPVDPILKSNFLKKYWMVSDSGAIFSSIERQAVCFWMGRMSSRSVFNLYLSNPISVLLT